jgi:hypothetical protein
MNTIVPAPDGTSSADVLIAAANYISAGSGSQASAYFFPYPIPELEGYILRITHETSLHSRLLHSSSLVPVKQLLRGINVGQPLMEVEGHPGMTIHLKQSGNSLRALENEYRRHHCDSDEVEIQDITAKMETILSLNGKGNPFLSVLKHTYQLGALGFLPDLSFRNILLDEENGRLNLVDQLSHRDGKEGVHESSGQRELNRCSEQLLEQLDRLALLAPDPESSNGMQFAATLDRLRGLITKAQQSVLQTPPSSDGISFSKVTDNSAIALKNPPKSLVTRLDQLRQEALQPAR